MTILLPEPCWLTIDKLPPPIWLPIDELSVPFCETWEKFCLNKLVSGKMTPLALMATGTAIADDEDGAGSDEKSASACDKNASSASAMFTRSRLTIIAAEIRRMSFISSPKELRNQPNFARKR